MTGKITNSYDAGGNLRTIPILFDVENLKVGCVLLCAIARCDPRLCHIVSSEAWETDTTDKLKRYIVSEAEIKIIAAKMNKKYPSKFLCATSTSGSKPKKPSSSKRPSRVRTVVKRSKAKRSAS